MVADGDNASLMGAYLHHDPVSMEDFIRSGSASNHDGKRNFECRNKEHKTASMNKKLADIKSRFYIRYPSKIDGHDDEDNHNHDYDKDTVFLIINMVFMMLVKMKME